MSTNFYFNNFPVNQVTPEQLLVEDLVIEAMQIKGMDVFYIERSSRDHIDYIYGEDVTSEFRRATPVEMYLENVTGMDGEGDFISKFGLEIRDEITMLVSRRRFKMSNNTIDRPREGDLVYVPMVQNFFEITFVEHENDQAMFHTLGRGRGGNVYLYALKLKQFVFSEEIIETGIEEIDIQIRSAYKKTRLPIANSVVAPWSTGMFIPDEIVYQGTSLATSTAQAVVYSYTANSTMDIIRVKGTFTTGNVKGNTSGSIRSVLLVDDESPFNSMFEDIADNKRIQTESDLIIDFTESNPFGET
jgi:hypothetical protein